MRSSIGTRAGEPALVSPANISNASKTSSAPPRLIKRIVIAGAVYHKIKIAQIARALGVSRSWASREAHHPETQRFIHRLNKQDPETAAASLRRALKTIAD